MRVERGCESLHIPIFAMSSAAIHILYKERIPATGVLVIPGRLNFEQLLQLERLFAERKITWLIEEDSTHDAAVRGHLEKSGSGAMFSAADTAPVSAGSQLQPYLANDGVLIYVPGRVAVSNAIFCHIPASHLRPLCAFGLPLLPIAIDCPRESSLSVQPLSKLATLQKIRSTKRIDNPEPVEGLSHHFVLHTYIGGLARIHTCPTRARQGIRHILMKRHGIPTIVLLSQNCTLGLGRRKKAPVRSVRMSRAIAVTGPSCFIRLRRSLRSTTFPRRVCTWASVEP